MMPLSKTDTLSFGAASKPIQPRAFSLMIKPIGSVCNLRCAYCYYLEKAELYSGHEPLMSSHTLEETIRQFFQAIEIPVASFCWHGGEPLIAGKQFFREAIHLQNKYKGNIQVENSLQTNGTLIDAEWCDFFRENHFLIGLSLDGPETIHNGYRKDTTNKGSFSRTLRAAQLMAEKHVDFNILCTINALSAGKGKEIYRFLRNITPFVQFLPVGTPLPSSETSHLTVTSKSPFAISGEEFGRFMCDVYDEWRKQDIGRIFVQLFDNTLALWCGQPSTLCSTGELCGGSLTVEHNGDVYCCDHFVTKDHLLGNLLTTPLKDLYASPLLFDFSASKFSHLPPVCRNCRWLFLCNGECPEHRTISTTTPSHPINSLCEGYKMFFQHTESDMLRMRQLLSQGLPPAMINS